MPETHRALSQRRHLHTFEPGRNNPIPRHYRRNELGERAFEPQRGWVILNMSRLPSVTGLIPREKLKAGNPNVPDGADISDAGHATACTAPGLVSPLDLPCNKPPWGAAGSRHCHRRSEVGFPWELSGTSLPFQYRLNGAPRTSAGQS